MHDTEYTVLRVLAQNAMPCGGIRAGPVPGLNEETEPQLAYDFAAVKGKINNSRRWGLPY